ncbi:hypothetical protein TSUD_142250, partial [Trifolium subterraneum]
RIPNGVSSWKNVVKFNASNNFFNGSIPLELTSLPRLSTLLLDQNQLTGRIPSDIISWKSLQRLDLSHNQLSGDIPDSICRLPSLVILDLSENKISGQIPPQLSLRLTNLNLSSNYLIGRIPSDFESLAYESSFLNNSGLCVDILVLNLALCNSGTTRRSRRRDSSMSKALVIILVVVASLTVFLARLSFTKSNIVSSMSEHNIIGSGGFGSVYRVAVEEYAQTIRVNEKIDVYSFGVVLLELTTGKEANHGDEYSSLAEWAWRHIQIGTNIEELLDDDAMEPSNLEEMCSIFKLGVMCTSTLPASRPSMKEVLKVLTGCKDPLANAEKIVDIYDSAPLLKNLKWEKQLEFSA